MKLKSLAFSALLAIFCVIIKSMAPIEKMCSLICALAIHELCHILAICFLGHSVMLVRLELSGLRIEYSGLMTSFHMLVCAAAGPIGGSLFGVLILLIEPFYQSEFLVDAAEFSLLLSGFNLLPILPLDGAFVLKSLLEYRFEENKTESICKQFSCILNFFLVCAGVICFLSGEGSGLFAASLWLWILQS